MVLYRVDCFIYCWWFYIYGVDGFKRSCWFYILLSWWFYTELMVLYGVYGFIRSLWFYTEFMVVYGVYGFIQSWWFYTEFVVLYGVDGFTEYLVDAVCITKLCTPELFAPRKQALTSCILSQLQYSINCWSFLNTVHIQYCISVLPTTTLPVI